MPDVHCPFQDKKALKSFYNFIKWFKPDVIINMGDLIDFYAISDFVKDPIRALKLQEELDEGRVVLEEVRNICPKAEIHFIYGNHENRLKKYKWSNAKEFNSLRNLELEKLLDFDSLNIISHPNGMMKYKGVIVKHGNVVRKFAGYTAKAEFEKNGMSGVSCHTHRLATYRHTNESGDYIWIEAGCLCKLNAEYLKGQKANWQMGFAIGYFKENSKRYLIETVPIIDNKAMYGGMLF